MGQAVPSVKPRVPQPRGGTANGPAGGAPTSPPAGPCRAPRQLWARNPPLVTATGSPAPSSGRFRSDLYDIDGGANRAGAVVRAGFGRWASAS